VTTGAQREHRHDVLVAQAAGQGIALEPIRHYVDCFRFGCPPHGGLGIGIGRLLMKLLDLPSIREATLFFRGPTVSPRGVGGAPDPVAGVSRRWFNAGLGSARRC
jgi:aspartyl/asparaginyl-tRNA synthetase